MKDRRRLMFATFVLPLLAFGGYSLLNGSGAPLTSKKAVETYLQRTAVEDVPGLQYVVVDPDNVLFDHAAGWADVGSKTAMTPSHTLMAFSMTKTFTAVAMLQLVERGAIGLDDSVDDYLPDVPYTGRGVTIRHLLAHTSGAPNPIPLRWVHLSSEEDSFDEDAALNDVLAENRELRSNPGDNYSYSNIGYWLLGKVIEKLTGESYVDYMQDNVLTPLGLASPSMGYTISETGTHASGYLARYSFTNLIKPFLTDSRFWGDYEENWLRVRDHHLNGPAFGGLVGTARAFGTFLQDQLQPESVLLGAETRRLLQAPQATNSGVPIPMTLGWHIAETETGIRYLYKEGGGGGFHTEMRLYPDQGLGTVIMVNATDFDSTGFLNHIDPAFLTTSEQTGR